MGEECLPDVCYFGLIFIFIVQAPNNKENVRDTKLWMPMPKLISSLTFTHYASPITHHASRITQKNELEYFDMNAMPRVIPTCPNMNMV